MLVYDLYVRRPRDAPLTGPLNEAWGTSAASETHVIAPSPGCWSKEWCWQARSIIDRRNDGYPARLRFGTISQRLPALPDANLRPTSSIQSLHRRVWKPSPSIAAFSAAGFTELRV